jgi:hypothetical protein
MITRIHDAQSRSGRRGFTLVILRIGVLLIAALLTMMYGRGVDAPGDRPPGGPTTSVGQAMDRGTEVACRNNLQQIRLAITMERSAEVDEGPPPHDLTVLQRQGIGPQMLLCPVSGAAYLYDSRNAHVWCQTVGHEAF